MPFITQAQYEELAAQSETPDTGNQMFYPKTDGNWYVKDDAGVETLVSTGAVTDADAIHDNVSGEIAAVTEKASPAGTDLLLIEDSAASNAKKRVQIANLPATDAAAIHDDVAGEIAALTEKVTPVSGDHLLIEDSADSNNKKRVQVGNLPTGIGGSTGATDNALLRADGTGGSTVQASAPTVDDSGNMNLLDAELQRPLITDYAEKVNTDADSTATHSIDLETGNVHDLTLTANCTISFTNPPATGRAGSFTLILRQDGTGSRTVTWPAAVKWAGGTAPTLTTTASAIDILTFVTVDAGTNWFGFLAGLAFA